jgi:hypothetical protein
VRNAELETELKGFGALVLLLTLAALAAYF